MAQVTSRSRSGDEPAPSTDPPLRLVDPEADQRFLLHTAARVKKVIDSPDYTPPLLPDVAVHLTHIANDPNVDMGEVEATICRDPLIAARVISTADSALYASDGPANSLRVAMMRLGLVALRDVAFRVVAQTQIFRVPAYAARMHELFETGLAAGVIAREVCKTLRFGSETAFLCGLLRDMGEAIVLGVVGTESRQRAEKPPSLAAMAPVIDRYHAAAGAQVCRLWKLPETITDSIRFHHQPERSTHPTQMAMVLAVTDVLLQHAGISAGSSRVLMARQRSERNNVRPARFATA